MSEMISFADLDSLDRQGQVSPGLPEPIRKSLDLFFAGKGLKEFSFCLFKFLAFLAMRRASKVDVIFTRVENVHAAPFPS